MVFFYFNFFILALTTLRRRGDPIIFCIAPRHMLFFPERFKGLILNIPGEITLLFFTTFDPCGVGIEFEVIGFDKVVKNKREKDKIRTKPDKNGKRLPKFKYNKEHLCPSCEQGKSKRAFHPPKPVPNSRQILHLLHMDLCGPMRIASINEKRYVLVIVDDYSRYTWVHFLRSKDEALEVIIKFLKRIMVLLQSPVIIIRTVNGTEFKNQVLKEYFDTVGISHQMSSVRTPVYNRRTKKIMETMNVSFDELFAMAFEQRSSKPELQTGSKSRHPLLNKENYVPWSSHLLRYAKSRPNGKLIHNSIINGPLKLMIKLFRPFFSVFLKTSTLLLIGEEGQVVQRMGKNVRNLNGYNAVQNVRNQVAQNPRVQNVGNQNGKIGVPGNANLNGNGNLVAARAEGNKEEAGIQLQAEEYDLTAAAADLDEIEEVNANCILMANLQQASTSGTQTDKAPVYDSDGSDDVHDYENCDDNEIFNMFTQEEQYTELLEPIPESQQVPQNDNNVISEVTSVEQGREIVEQHPANFEETQKILQLAQESREKMKQLNRDIKPANYTKINHLSGSSSAHQELHKIIKDENPPIVNQVDARVQNFEIQFLKEAAKFVGDFKSLANEDDESLSKHKALELEIKCLLISQDIMNIVRKETIVDTSDLQTELERMKECFENYMIKKENEYAKLWNDCDTSANTKFKKQSIVENLPKVGEIHALSKPVTSNSVSKPQEPKVVKHDKVISPGMFRINHFKTSREEKHVPNTVRASNRTKPITVSQPPVFTKKDVNSDSNGLSSTRIDNTKTRRPWPSSNTKNDRVPSASKSSRSKNKEAEVEEHHRNLLLSKNNKHMSSACNNIKLDSQNAISKVVYSMCKKCLISINHDVCLRNYVNGKNSHGKKHKANVSIKEKQKKHQPHVKKPKKVGFLKRLATPKPRKPRFLLRWSSTGRLFDQKGKIVDSSESESQSDCSNGDNACTSNTLEPKIKRFPNYTSLLGRLSRFVCGNLKLLINFVWKFMGTVRFRNDHVAAILGFGQFYDLDLEVAFRRNACFVRNLEGVDLLKRDHSTNLYTINLHEMASTSPICLMARASSTKPWL
nr:integrase, catalytic region, zinc finger, CCHC-type, peptidase aspartic, catalytic [Tanacetum cinerariifolium]